MRQVEKDYWLRYCQPEPAGVAGVEALGFALPPAYAEGMLRRNGGLIRIGRSLWYLLPLPPGVNKTGDVLWRGVSIRDLPALRAHFSNFPGFPPAALPIGLCQDGWTQEGAVLYLSGSEVWAWHYQTRPYPPQWRSERLLERVGDLWRDNPAVTPRAPRALHNWKIKQRRLARSPYRDAAKAVAAGPGLSGWLAAGSITLVTGRLALGDGLTMPLSAEVSVLLPPGEYQLLLRRSASRVAAVCLLAAGHERQAGFARDPLPEVIIDTATLAISERSLLEGEQPAAWQAWAAAAEDYYTIDNPDLNACGLALFDWGGSPAVVVRTGGDGKYPAWVLHAGERVLGLELEFVAGD